MKPCLVSSRSWMICGRSSDSAYENVVNQNPGRSSSVMAAPPTRCRRSRISVLEPGLGEVGAVDEAVVAATDDDRVVGPVGLRGRADGLVFAGGALAGLAVWPASPAWRASSSSCQAVFRSGL